MVIFAKAYQPTAPSPVIAAGIEGFLSDVGIVVGSMLVVPSQATMSLNMALDNAAPIIWEFGRRVSQIPWPQGVQLTAAGWQRLRVMAQKRWIPSKPTFMTSMTFGCCLLANGSQVGFVVDRSRLVALRFFWLAHDDQEIAVTELTRLEQCLRRARMLKKIEK